MSHTPGPWEVQGDRWVIARQPGNRTLTIAEVNKADARLIAAAPELLEVARFIRERAEEFEPGYPELTALVDAAYTKATGEQP